MQLHKIKSNGKEYIFNVINNFTEPCPQCGVPACGREDIIWFENNEKKEAIIYDGSYFELAIEAFFLENSEIKYENLPNFLKEWSELRGWVKCYDYNGYELDVNDFLKSIALLKTCKLQKWITLEELNAIENLAKKAKEQKKQLKIVMG